jgi:hypothetical protein
MEDISVRINYFFELEIDNKWISVQFIPRRGDLIRMPDESYVEVHSILHKSTQTYDRHFTPETEIRVKKFDPNNRGDE